MVFAKGKPKKTFVVDEETEINVLTDFEANRENSIRGCARVNKLFRNYSEHFEKT